jgi:hypothetical protein
MAKEATTACLRVCRLERIDVVEVLVGQGLARDCPRFSSERYPGAEGAIEQGGMIHECYELPDYRMGTSDVVVFRVRLKSLFNEDPF